jgi:uncharacterized repeat protein (TIGR03803 family)
MDIGRSNREGKTMHVKQLCNVVLTTVMILGPSRFAAAADTEIILHTFTDENGDGSQPSSGLVFDPAGNVYGTTYGGGAYLSGTVYKMASNLDGTWTESIIYSFTGGSDGFDPGGTLALDSSGNLYGTTRIGGGNGCSCGTVFELSPSSSGWNYRLLYTFTGGVDGSYPEAPLALDSIGRIYGSAFEGGAFGVGTVFSLAPKPGGKWRFSLLHTFTGGKDGGYPATGLIFDAAGDLYAATAYGGTNCNYRLGCGVAYKLTPGVGGWKETVLHTFTGGLDGEFPSGDFIFDSAGNLYGVAGGGGINGEGVVYELEPSSDGWREQVLHAFIGKPDGASPNGRLLFDAAGNLYGATGVGGVGFGTAYELTPSGGRWICTLLYTFYTSHADSANPTGGFVMDSAGNLYGAAAGGGYYAAGTVFELSPP